MSEKTQIRGAFDGHRRARLGTSFVRGPRGPRSPASTPARALGIVATVVAATAFVPLGLVLPPRTWVLALTLAGFVSTAAIVGFVKGEPMAFAAPFVLLTGWLLVQ